MKPTVFDETERVAVEKLLAGNKAKFGYFTEVKGSDGARINDLNKGLDEVKIQWENKLGIKLAMSDVRINLSKDFATINANFSKEDC